MDFDLNRLMCKNDQPFTDQSIQYFVHQILRGLKYMHSASIIHRDIKPENILLSQDVDVMICDFGLSRSMIHGEYPDESKYVVTRWYRAPEVILFWDQLNKAIDIWSVGCILAELLSCPQRQIFVRGSNFKDQLDLILRKCGTPVDLSEMKGSIAGLQYYRDHYANVFYPRVNFQELFPRANPLAIDLLDKMLQIDPDKRITVDQALAHPYLSDMHDESDEIECSQPFTFNVPLHMSREQIKQVIYEEMVSWHNEQRMVEMDQRKQFLEHQVAAAAASTVDMNANTDTNTHVMTMNGTEVTNHHLNHHTNHQQSPQQQQHLHQQSTNSLLSSSSIGHELCGSNSLSSNNGNQTPDFEMDGGQLPPVHPHHIHPHLIPLKSLLSPTSSDFNSNSNTSLGTPFDSPTRFRRITNISRNQDLMNQ